jgi:hypothetical protein
MKLDLVGSFVGLGLLPLRLRLLGFLPLAISSALLFTDDG